jgi:site-specific DNA-methyltransferase (adenine-specific)
MTEAIQWINEKWKLKDLKDYDRNPRKMGKEEFGKLVESLKSDGYHHRLLINTDGTIIGGHARKKALLKAGHKENDEIEVLVPNRRLTDEEFDRVNIRDNLPYGSFDFDMLANNFEAAQLIEWGMPADWLTEVDEEVAVDESDNEVPEIPEEPITKLGDIWKLGEHRLMCGDSVSITDVEKLMNNNKADMIFTDPPYGYKYESNHYKNDNPFGMLENDDKIIDFLPLLRGIIQNNCPIYICGSHQTVHKWRELAEKEFTYKNTIVWKKNNWSMGDLKGAYACQHELILFVHHGRAELKGERHRDVWEFDRDPPENHPTQKPIDLVVFALKNSSDKNNLVLDLFGGSGSTLIACEKSKRKCFMMELSPNYCDVIIARWEKLTKLKAELIS